MAKNYERKKIITFIASLAAILVMVFFTSCGKDKKENKRSEKEQVSGYVYETAYKELGTVNASDMPNVCISKDGIYMTAPYYDFDENMQVKSITDYFMSCPMDSDKINITEIKDLKKDEHIDSFLLDKDNNPVMLTSIENYNEEDGSFENENYLINIDISGKISKRTKLLPDLAEGERFNSGRSGAFYIGDKLFVGSDSKIYTFNEDGSAGNTIEVESFITYMFADSNGKIYVMSNKNDKQGIFELNQETGRLGKAFTDDGNNITGIENAKQFGNGNVYLSDRNKVLECNLEKNKCETLFSWINVGIDQSKIIDFAPMEDGSIVVVCSEANMDDVVGITSSFDIELLTINKKKASEVKQKKENYTCSR